jgi:hypothetical protein
MHYDGRTGESSVGFESAYAARRRLAVLAMSNERVQEALAPSTFPGFELESPQLTVSSNPVAAHTDVAQHLDQLAQDIISTPGAGGALLVAFAAQARALSLVMEAALRTPGAQALPADVMSAVQAALCMPSAVSGLELAWQR